MQGVLFDTERLKKGLPIRWKLFDNETDRFGLITGVTDETITIVAINNLNNFLEKSYPIEDIVEFELLGEWTNE